METGAPLPPDTGAASPYQRMTETVNIACIPLWRCDNCSATADQTPLQRRGPRGVGTLCNACGLWYAKTGSMRSTRGPRQSKKAESFRASLPSSQTASATLLHSSSSAFHCPTPGSLKRFRSADSDDLSHRSSTHRVDPRPGRESQEEAAQLLQLAATMLTHARHRAEPAHARTPPPTLALDSRPAGPGRELTRSEDWEAAARAALAGLGGNGGGHGWQPRAPAPHRPHPDAYPLARDPPRPMDTRLLRGYVVDHGPALPRGHARGLARLALAPAPCYAPPRAELAHPQRVVHSTAQAVLDLLAEALLDRGRAEA
ncbi:hypothetical protein ACKKBF_B02670 [Auxenochlorella protothecoides x Auxenochlorella symbiontica]